MSSQEDTRDGTGLCFSIFKYKFHNLLTEIRVLKDKEHSAKLEAETLAEKLMHAESSCEKLRNVSQAQAVEFTDARQKLENTVRLMGLEAAAIEEKVRSLKSELATVLETRNVLTDELRATNYHLECKLKSTTGQLTTALEKVGRHTMLIEAAERETLSVKRVLDETRQLVDTRSGTVNELQSRLEWMSNTEQKLLERTRLLEGELKKRAPSQARDEEIVALKKALQSLRSDSDRDVRLATLQKAVEVKESQLCQIKQEKQELLRETERLKAVMNKFQEAAAHQESILNDVREELQRYTAEKEECGRRICSLQEILNKNELQINKISTEKEILRLDREALEKRLKLLEETNVEVDVRTSTSENVESKAMADAKMQGKASDPPSDKGFPEEGGSLPVIEENEASQTEQCNVQPQDVDNQEARDKRDQAAVQAVLAGPEGASQKPVIVDTDRPMLDHSAPSFHNDRADTGSFHPSGDDVKACSCGQAASGDTVKCAGCGNEYHATCINWLSSSPEYFCTSCQTQPGTKRMRVLEPENANW